MSCNTGSTKIAYNNGDSGYPCVAPRCTAQAGDRADPTRPLLDAHKYIADRAAKAGPVTPHLGRRWSRRVAPLRHKLAPLKKIGRTWLCSPGFVAAQPPAGSVTD